MATTNVPPGVEGNEQADQRARKAAALPFPGTTIIAFLRHVATERATGGWREDIESGNVGRRTVRLSTASTRSQLRRVTKRVAARFFQLLSGHAVIAPFLKERCGWTDSDRCWWCEKGRQSREHLFKECTT